MPYMDRVSFHHGQRLCVFQVSIWNQISYCKSYTNIRSSCFFWFHHEFYHSGLSKNVQGNNFYYKENTSEVFVHHELKQRDLWKQQDLEILKYKEYTLNVPYFLFLHEHFQYVYSNSFFSRRFFHKNNIRMVLAPHEQIECVFSNQHYLKTCLDIQGREISCLF